MKPKFITLVRHGESEGNIDPKVYVTRPDHSLHLTTKGVEQAKEAGRKLKEAMGPSDRLYVYSSTFTRTRETTKYLLDMVGPRSKKIVEDPRLREQEWGNFNHGEPWREEEREKFGSFYYRFPTGESGADVYDRVSGFLETMYRDFSKEDYPEHSLIVTHGFTMRIFLMRWFHWSPEFFHTVKNPKNCQAITMSLIDGRYQLLTKLAKHNQAQP